MGEIEVSQIFAAADTDGDGVISFQEFCAAAAVMPVLMLGLSLLSTDPERQDAKAAREVANFATQVDGTVRRGTFTSYTAYTINVEVDYAVQPIRVERRFSEFL